MVFELMIKHPRDTCAPNLGRLIRTKPLPWAEIMYSWLDCEQKLPSVKIFCDFKQKPPLVHIRYESNEHLIRTRLSAVSRLEL